MYLVTALCMKCINALTGFVTHISNTDALERSPPNRAHVAGLKTAISWIWQFFLPRTTATLAGFWAVRNTLPFYSPSMAVIPFRFKQSDFDPDIVFLLCIYE
jgi:hypothetical protein